MTKAKVEEKAEETEGRNEPLEMWVGWCVRPFDGGWGDRKILIPVSVMEMFAVDQPHPADRRELVVAKIASEVSHPSLVTKTDWGTPIGHSPVPPEPEVVEMVDTYVINAVGLREARYRKVPKAAYDALPEEVRANHPLRTT